MSWQPRTKFICTMLAFLVLAGCHPTQPFYFNSDGDLSHYLDTATQLEDPDVNSDMLPEVNGAQAPYTLTDPEFQEFWDLQLEDCISIALQNSKVIRDLGAVSSGINTGSVASTGAPATRIPDRLIGASDSSQTIYDPAVFETDPQAGVEAALSVFDAQFSSSLIHARNETPQNIAGGIGAGGAFFPNVGISDTTTFNAEISKQSATGATFAVRNSTVYDAGNGFGALRALPDFYTTSFQAEARMPILRGRGTQVNRVPVMIARIRHDVSLADFEAGIRNLLANIENAYWDLHCSYRNLQTNKSGRDSSLLTWKITYEKWKNGASPVNEEAQAREQYYNFRSQVEGALRDLYNKENNLRWLMGLAPTDGRLIRPIDEPTVASVAFDWHQVHPEALARTAELRRIKWIIKQRELELIRSRNQLLPQLDVFALYGVNGAGDDLVNSTRNGINFPNPGSTAFESLTDGDFTQAQLGVELSLPIGFRNALSGVRNSQLQLAREKARLEDMELNVSHVMTLALRDLDGSYQLAQTHFNRWTAAKKEVDTLQVLYESGASGQNAARSPLDLLLDAQRRRALAQIAYYQSICDYNKAIAQVHYRKGSLLEYNNVNLAEGPWPSKAYADALGHARRRDAAHFMNYGWSRPNVMSRGPHAQFQGTAQEGVPVEGGAVIEGETVIEGGYPSEIAPVQIAPETGDEDGTPFQPEAPEPGSDADERSTSELGPVTRSPRLLRPSTTR